MVISFTDRFFSKQRAVVGICGMNADSASVRAMMTQMRSAGVTPLFFGNHANRNAQDDIQKIDALVVLGNNADIDPALYGETPHPKTNIETATPEGRARAEYEYAMIREAAALQMPFLGICGGMQKLNVALGGSLYQHIPDITGNDDHAQQKHNIAPFTPTQLIHIVEGSTLAKIGESIFSLFVPGHQNQTYAENSMHHQAVHRLGDGLRASAYADDLMPDGSKLIQAVEVDPHGPLSGWEASGVQWHPEFGASELSPKIANDLAEKAHQFAQKNKRLHPQRQAAAENVFSLLDVVKPDLTAIDGADSWAKTIRERSTMQATVSRT